MAHCLHQSPATPQVLRRLQASGLALLVQAGHSTREACASLSVRWRAPPGPPHAASAARSCPAALRGAPAPCPPGQAPKNWQLLTLDLLQHRSGTHHASTARHTVFLMEARMQR